MKTIKKELDDAIIKGLKDKFKDDPNVKITVDKSGQINITNKKSVKIH